VRPPVRRGVLVLMPLVCSKRSVSKAVDLVSGPGGLASFLRTRELGARLDGPSLPLDVGYAGDVPPSIRRAVLLRARGHCEWPGGCRQPGWACQVHHVVPKSAGGTTSVQGCALLCFYHHEVVIHRWGWTLVVNGDGTTTAWNKDKSKIFAKVGRIRR
jgi:HNH endonuclease